MLIYKEKEFILFVFFIWFVQCEWTDINVIIINRHKVLNLSLDFRESDKYTKSKASLDCNANKLNSLGGS